MSTGSVHRVQSATSSLIDKPAVAATIGVHLKRSSNPYRKPSFYFPRMRDAAEDGGPCAPSPSFGTRKATEPLLFAEHLGTAHPLFSIASSSCEYYALRLPLLKAGFKRVGLALNRNVPANLVWGRSMIFETVTVDRPDGSGKTRVVRTPKAANPESQAHYDALSMTVEQQRFNHYPYSHRNMGCKRGLGLNLRRVQELLTTGMSRNKKLAQQVKVVQEKYQFVPKTWFYPAEKETLVDIFKKAPPSQHFIWKPARGSCGRGICITKGGIQNAASWEQVMKEINTQSLEHPGGKVAKDYVVQEYLEDPYLLNGRKMDLRLYVCVTSYDPLIIYLHEEGLVRLAADTYAAEPNHDSDNLNTTAARFKHLTNYSIGRRYKQGGHVQHANGMDENHRWAGGEPLRKAGEGTSTAVAPVGATDPVASAAAAPAAADWELKWSLQRLWDYVDANSGSRDGSTVLAGRLSASAKLKRDIALLITRTVMAVKPVIGPTVALVETPGSFVELYGFDVMLDKDLRPYLVEVNTLPSLESSSPFDYATKTNVVADMLNLARLEPFERDPQKLALYLNDAKMTKKVDPRVAAFVHTLEEQQSRRGQSMPSLPLKDEIACRLADELEYARGFKRIFPPLQGEEALQTGSPISIQNREMKSDLLLFAKAQLLSKHDFCALNGS